MTDEEAVALFKTIFSQPATMHIPPNTVPVWVQYEQLLKVSEAIAVLEELVFRMKSLEK